MAVSHVLLHTREWYLQEHWSIVFIVEGGQRTGRQRTQGFGNAD
jgi:hypothetical protein